MVLLAVLVLLILGVGYAALSGLNTAAAAPERSEATRRALVQAKQALLAYAAQEYRGANWSETPTSRNNKPGSLPCPSRKLSTTTNQSLWGTAVGNCSSTAGGGSTLVGRLPWRTLEMPELTDASGERLWYAVSASHASSSAYSSQPVNFETPGKIEVTGTSAAARNVIAVIIAPGPVLAGQDRSGANIDVAANYIEGAQIDSTAAAMDRYFSGPADATVTAYNDVVVTITREELADAIEAAIALRVKRTVLPYLAEHYSHWGWLPFGHKPAAAPSWFDPQTASYQTSPPATQGHLPVALDSAYLAWTNEAIAKVGIPGSLTGSYPCNLYSFIGPPGAPDDGMPVPRVTLRCTRDYSGPTVGYSFTARLDKAAMALVRSVTIDVTVTNGSPTLPTRTVSVSGPDATLTYTGTLTGTTGTVTFDLVANVSDLNAVLPSEDVAWLFSNGWHRLIYYSVAEGAKPGASTTCPIDCLTVNVQGATSSARAVLVLPGRGVERAAGAWQTRPSGAAIDYFEGLNAVLPATTFEQRMRGRQFDASDTYTGVFNDRVVPFN